MVKTNYEGYHYHQIHRKKEKKKKQDQNLSFKETLLGIARKRVSLKVEGIDAQQT